MKITDTTTITATVQDPDAALIHDLLQRAHDHGNTAWDHVVKRARLMADAGDILERRKKEPEYSTWLNLHFTEESLPRHTRRGCLELAKARRTSSIQGESRKEVMRLLTQCEMLPGFDGVQGSKKPTSHLTLVYKLHQHLCGMLQAELSPESRKQLKEDLQPILEVVARL